MQIIDLTVELAPDLPVYPGDPAVTIEPVATVERDGYAVARLVLSDQAGTHVETQAHFLAGGRTLAEEPLERFIARAAVVDVPCRRLELADLAPAADRIARNRALILRSGYQPPRGVIDPADPGRPRLPLDVLAWLVERGVRLLGIDAFDFDAAPDYTGHRYLLAQGVVIVESLTNLAALTAPEVVLFVVPLRLRGTGAAPCRAFALLP